MFIEQPTWLYSRLYPKAVCRKIPKQGKCVYLTFDDGPIPEVTPWVLDVLDQYNVKATFFCVGDNVRKYPEVYQMVLDRGHRVGNHTFNHIRSYGYNLDTYLHNIDKAERYISSSLFRPPHGEMKRWHYKAVLQSYEIILFDVITRDYNRKIAPEKVLHHVKKYTRNGSIIVFHDSLRSQANIAYALPKAIEWLLEQGYECALL